MSEDDKTSEEASADGSFEKPAALSKALSDQSIKDQASNDQVLDNQASNDQNPKDQALDNLALDNEAVKSEPASSTVKARSFGICELGVSVLLLSILSFLFVNVSVLYLAKQYNDTICRTSIGYAGDAATRGLDTREVCIAAFKCMDKCGIGGFFIEHPRICQIKDEITPNLRTLTISMSTKALLPSPFLIADRSVLDADGQHRTFFTTYVFKLNNPKNCGDNFNVVSPDGKLHGPQSRKNEKGQKKETGKKPEPGRKDAATGGGR